MALTITNIKTKWMDLLHGPGQGPSAETLASQSFLTFVKQESRAAVRSYFAPVKLVSWAGTALLHDIAFTKRKTPA